MSSDAVIFIPGVRGTKLIETNKTPFDTIWSGVQYNLETIEDLELSFKQGSEFFDQKMDTIIHAGEIEELAYKEFLTDLKTDKPIFIFNYDWRLSAKTNAKRLHEFVSYLSRKAKALAQSFEQFDFITHSLGNAVFRAYLKKYGAGKMHRTVFVTPPFDGSIDIISAALVGEGFFDNVKAKFRKLVRTFPGALELLPSYEEVGVFEKGTRKVNFFNPNHWQSNVTQGGDRLAEKFKAALGFAKSTLKNDVLELSDLPLDVRKRMLVIARHGYQTWQSVPVLNNERRKTTNLVDFESGMRNDNGDGRVPHVSSCKYHASVKTLMLKDSFFFREYDHGFIMKDERVQKLVNRFLFRASGGFKHDIASDSVGVVKDLVRETNARGLPYWEAKVRY